MNFNAKIAEYFLKNTRLTLLLFLLLMGGGIIATLLLKTTGFPSPNPGFALVQTFYLGASSETVAEEVSSPIESAIKDIEGISSISSSSNNSISIVSISLKDGVDTDQVIGKMQSAIAELDLPEGVEDSKIFAPDIAGPDYLFSIVASSKKELYESFELLETAIQKIPETSEVSALNPIEKRVLIELKEEKLLQKGIRQEEILAALISFGESLPVGSNLSLDGQNQSLVTSLEDEQSLYDLNKLKIRDSELNDLAAIKLVYEFKNLQSNEVAFNMNGEPLVTEALTFQIKAIGGTDLNSYTDQILEVFKKITEEEDDLHFADIHDLPTFEEEKTYLIETYSVDTDNERQVKEVVSGLVGGPLEDAGAFSFLGYFLGGIQLVFLVMLAFVSWRAAVISALSIPLSILFTSLTLFVVGESLNTLVLFSLVLAIGLVVDPALVLLESIQRKLDAGIKGNEAGIQAVQDVGQGLMLAVITSIIVFIPFAVVSGILGQIIWFIPLTIIPSVIGSYIVPLIFLTWLGSKFLKTSPGKTDSEEENMWPIAKGLMNLNRWILKSSAVLRAFIVIMALLIPLGIAGSLFASGQVKSVQFSATENFDMMQLDFSFSPQTPQEKRLELTESALDQAMENQAVLGIFPMEGGSNFYYMQLKSAKDRGEYFSEQVAEDINKSFEDAGLLEEFFDLKVRTISNGPPAADYQMTLAIKTEDLERIKSDAQEVASVLEKLCALQDGSFAIEQNCESENGTLMVTKVDNGFEGKENQVIEVLLKREELSKKQLLIPNAPLTLLVNSALRNLFNKENPQALGQLSIDQEKIDFYLEGDDAPKTLRAVRDTVIFEMGEQKILLKDIAKIAVKDSQASISHLNGENISLVQARLKEDYADPGSAALATQTVLDYISENTEIPLEQYSEGDAAGFIKSFQELFAALVLAIFGTYLVLVVFFESFTQPLVILYSIPLTFLGVFPALAFLGNGQFGFLEIIGLIILVGVVENVAIFLIDAAKQKIALGWSDIDAISYASGIRLRAVLLTKFTAFASLTPLAILSDQYRSLALVIMFGLLTSGFTSLVTTPILFLFFRRISKRFHQFIKF